MLTGSAVGAYAYGVASAQSVDAADIALYNGWLSQKYNAGMAYMERNSDVRTNPDKLLEGAKTVIVCAFA